MKMLPFFLIPAGLFLFTPAHAAPEIGKEAPDFTLTDSNGKTHTLSDYRGKHIVLEWVNHGCPFVRKHYNSGNMQALQKQFTGEGVVWLAINTSAPGQQGHLTPETANAISKEKNAAHSALLLDPKGEAGKAYQAKVTPHMFIINPEGLLVYNGGIDSIPSTNAADIEKAEKYVVSALTASMAGEPIENSVTRPYGCAIKY